MLVDPPRDLTAYPRIVLHGVTGSGKSTLAARLSALTGAPHVPVDDLMWRPGWVQLTTEEQVEAIRPWAQRPAGFGQTEVMGMLTLNAWGGDAVGTSGRPTPMAPWPAPSSCCLCKDCQLSAQNRWPVVHRA